MPFSRNAPQGVPVAGIAEIVTGGVPVVVFTNLTLPGSYVTNPPSAPGSLFIDQVHTCGTVAGANGTTVELLPGQSATFDPFTGTLTANAVTSSFVFTAVTFG